MFIGRACLYQSNSSACKALHCHSCPAGLQYKKSMAGVMVLISISVWLIGEWFSLVMWFAQSQIWFNR